MLLVCIVKFFPNLINHWLFDASYKVDNYSTAYNVWWWIIVVLTCWEIIRSLLFSSFERDC